MFSCELCEISKNTFFTDHLWTAASVYFKEHSEPSQTSKMELIFIKCCILDFLVWWPDLSTQNFVMRKTLTVNVLYLALITNLKFMLLRQCSTLWDI